MPAGAINSSKVLTLGAALAGVLLLATGAEHLGYDASYALLWGKELAGGHVPAFHGPVAPTPHPLAIALGAVLSPLGTSAAGDALVALTTLSLAVAALAAARLARRLGGPAAGAIALVAVASRPQLAAGAWRGAVDLPALALVLLALNALTAGPPRPRRALWLLLPAGLLRPEVWALALATGAWAATRPGGRRRRLGRAALAVAAPALWLLWDLVLTGDPLFSLRGTQQLADQLDRPRTASLAPLLAGPSIRVVLGLPLMLAGIAGLVLLARRGGDHARLLIGVVLASLVSFGVLGLAGLPLLARYLLVPATLLAICAAVAATAPRGSRIAWAIAVLLLVAVPGTATGVRDAVRDGRTRRATQASLHALVAARPFRAAVARCGRVAVASYLLRPEVARGAGLTAARVAGADDADAALVLPASGAAVETLLGAGRSTAEAPLLTVPAGARLLTPRGGDWVLASCRSPR